MPSNTDPSVWEVVAFSVWAMPSPPPGAASHETYRSPIGEPRPRNTLPMMRPITFGNCAREEAFKSACAANKDRFFDGPYNKRHVFLKILLCHPDYQRRGAGTALTNWGIDAARRLGVNTTVFASPMGESLYEKLGFKKLGTFRVQSDGDAAFLEIPAMVLATATQRVQ
ncbi:hypothetical protein B0T17DRAFT_485472 [Bombardia bombarda]|uniref:N-acetyltransferase domain-containing protein n=1 Tax=Bombardia bombarda TaxID=252184 RepID=A0AA39XI56_9PEZI|nr:hypothetical protein B0T17DRAFT_485472 [Bombardia bombarda]